jgi:hydrogenase maturation protease
MMKSPSVLVAGIGNMFCGDDAFGLEVVGKLSTSRLSPEVRVVDFGIRGFDLAFALMDGYDLNILVDAVQRGGPPGTLYLIEPDLENPDDLDTQSLDVDAHGMNPLKALRLAKQMGGQIGRVLVLGCEPETLEPEDEERLGLSPVVQKSVEAAANRIEKLVAETLATNRLIPCDRA